MLFAKREPLPRPAAASAAAAIPDSHAEREAAVQRAIDQANAEHERRCAELTDAIAAAHAEQARAIREARASADARRESLDRTLAVEIAARLVELVDLADENPREAAIGMVDAWADCDSRARRELGEGVSPAHLLYAVRREAGVGDLYRNAAPRGAPIDYTHASHEPLRELVAALEQGDRVLVQDRLQRLRVAVRRPTDLSFVDSEKTSVILAHVTERDQRAALADLDERRERERQQRHANGAAAVVPTETPKRGEPEDLGPVPDPGWFPPAA